MGKHRIDKRRQQRNQKWNMTEKKTRKPGGWKKYFTNYTSNKSYLNRRPRGYSWGNTRNLTASVWINTSATVDRSTKPKKISR